MKFRHIPLLVQYRVGKRKNLGQDEAEKKIGNKIMYLKLKKTKGTMKRRIKVIVANKNRKFESKLN